MFDLCLTNLKKKNQILGRKKRYFAQDHLSFEIFFNILESYFYSFENQSHPQYSIFF